MRYLVTGGAGYVGSHIVLHLLDRGHDVHVIDNLSTGHARAVPQGVHLHKVDLMDASGVNTVLAHSRWDAVFHLAARSLVGESLANPFLYLEQNFLTSFNIITACVRNDVKKFVFSSTAALFGGPTRRDQVSEISPILPDSPYGESKYFVERMLHWADTVYGLRSACLRYFNAAGADPQGRAGEDHRPETHLIPLALDAMLQRRAPLQLFGTEYDTQDGTCIRDYIHVSDLADAHLRALDLINEKSVVYNLGYGVGHSNLDIIKCIERQSGRAVPWQPAPPRLGDPTILVADSSAFKRDSGWVPQRSDIDIIVQTALSWRERHPQGYGDA